MSASSDKHIVFIHGRGAKPAEAELHTLWEDALRAGLVRDHPGSVEHYKQTNKHMVYYADHLTGFVDAGYNETLDLDNRRRNLDDLTARGKPKDFRRKHYEALPGKTPLKEFVMDMSASIGLGGLATRKAMPELHHYWRDENGWAKKMRQSLTTQLDGLMTAQNNVLIISHCMGSVLAWDSLWQLSHEHSSANSVLAHWITLGSPLGANSVRGKLLGNSESGIRRYPTVLNAWHNVAAEDDYVCHDKTVANDYQEMLTGRVIGDIRDHTIYNLSVRYGRSNPHSSAGYLIHPRTSELVSAWLKA